MKPDLRVRVLPVMKSCLVALLALAACGGASSSSSSSSSPSPGPGDDPPGVVQDTRSELEKRRDTGCEQLRPRLVQCAVDDARAELEAGRMSQADFQANTAPEVTNRLGVEWMKSCRVEMSSRQVRVLEVCFREETACAPLLACLEHLNKPAT